MYIKLKITGLFALIILLAACSLQPAAAADPGEVPIDVDPGEIASDFKEEDDSPTGSDNTDTVTVRQDKNGTWKAIVTIPVSCDLGGTVKITRRSSDAPAPDPAQLVLKDRESRVTTITFTEPGTYRYRFSQIVKKKKASVLYDRKPYDVTVYVSSTDEALEPYITVVRGSKKTDLVHFANRKKPAESPARKSSPSSPARAASVRTGDEKSPWLLPAVSAALISCLMMAIRKKGGDL